MLFFITGRQVITLRQQPYLQQVRIFEPFYRPEGVPADAPGVGLGLSIARGLAELQGGSLIYSERPGGGSVFTLRVPAINVADPAS